MQSDTTPAPTAARPLLGAVRHHVLVVVLCLIGGLLIGWLAAAARPATYESTAHVLVNPTVGNPFAPTPVSVRQDELTSLETEAQVARSAEVLGEVAAENPPLTLRQLQNGASITVPANTQILQLSYAAADPDVAQQITDAWSAAYLSNRDRRAVEVNAERITRVESQTQTVVDDLRAATTGSQRGTAEERAFQLELAGALRNELVSLRAQRSYLENSDAPAGSVISSASTATETDTLTPLLMLAGGALGGLLLGCLIAIALERLTGVVRSAPEVEAAGLPVLAAVPARGLAATLRRTPSSTAVEATIRRLRTRILDRERTAKIIAVAPAGSRGPETGVSEAVAESFAKAGHRVVLVRAGGATATDGLGVEERGLAEALVHDRLRVLEMLQPSVEPLLCLLPWGSNPQSSELLDAGRLRTVLKPLVDAGHLVVLQSPGIDTAEGEAVVGAADLGLVVVTTGRTRARDVTQATTHIGPNATALAALVIDRRNSVGRTRQVTAADAPDREDSVAHDPATRSPR